jgi:hypothetical protein
MKAPVRPVSASGAGHLSAAQVSSITPAGPRPATCPPQACHRLRVRPGAPALYAYLIPLLAATFLLALILKEIPLRTRAQRDAAQAAPVQPGARPQGAAATSLSTSQPPAAPPQVVATPTTLRRPGFLTAGITRRPSEPHISTIRISR